MTGDENLGEQLLKLVVEWRKRADNSAGNIPVATEKCADELEELIERHSQLLEETDVE